MARIAGLALALILGACASSPPPGPAPMSWGRAGGAGYSAAELQAAMAQCRAEALQAGARHGAWQWARRSYAQAGEVDWSQIGQIGDTLQRNREMQRQQQMRDQIMNATMEACMARAGFLRQ